MPVGSTRTRLPDPSAQHQLIARAAEIGKSWTELPGTRQRDLLTALIERIDVRADQINIHLRLTRLAAFFDVPTPLPSTIRTPPIAWTATSSGDQATGEISRHRSYSRRRAGQTLSFPGSRHLCHCLSPRKKGPSRRSCRAWRSRLPKAVWPETVGDEGGATSVRPCPARPPDLAYSPRNESSKLTISFQ